MAQQRVQEELEKKKFAGEYEKYLQEKWENAPEEVANKRLEMLRRWLKLENLL